MPTSPTITITGNLVRDPEMRFTPGGHATCKLTVACTPRERDASGEWKDGDPQYWDVITWRNLAENCAASLLQGDPVIVSGIVKFRQWVTKEGEKRHQHEITADAVGISLMFHEARVRRSARSKPAPAANGNGNGNTDASAASDADAEPAF